MPQISVIIPCYNQAKYIGECLNSVLAQTFQDYEIVVVNDGSTDNSLQIINQFVEKYKNLRIIDQSNQGVVAARNNAVAQAYGKYIYPLDADDMIVPECLEKLYKVISTTNYRVVASEVYMFGKRSGFFRQPKFTKYDMYGWHECCVISALFYKEDFERFGGYKMDFNGYGGDDMDYWLNYLDYDYSMLRVPEVLFFYRVKEQEDSLWKNYSKQEMKKRVRQKNAYLLKYHPKMRLWSILYRLFHCRFVKFFYRDSIKNNFRRIKILGITVYRSKELSNE